MRSLQHLAWACVCLATVLGFHATRAVAQTAPAATTTTTTTHTTVETTAPAEAAPVAAPTPAETAQAAAPAEPEPTAQAAVSTGGTWRSNTEGEDTRAMWMFGGQFRHHWVPTAVQSVFMDMAPSIKGNAYSVLASRRNASGFSLTFGLSYADYAFEGYFREKGDDLGETEFVRSDLSFWHVTSSFMWSTEFLGFLAFEYGFGLDLGLVFGDINRTEAYRDPTRGWQPCEAAGNPAFTDNGEAYCDAPLNGGDTDPSDVRGAHYNVDVGKISGGGSIPDIMLLPAIPQLAIRIMPIKNVAVRLEAAYSIVQFWVGASLLVGFEVGEAPRKAPPPPPPTAPVVARTEVIERRVEVAPPPVVAPPPPAKGRVKGTVWNEAGQQAVAGATVKLIGMELSALVSADDGTFTTYELDPGLVTFEITHPDYETATCAATIPEAGGDVNARCVVVEKPKKGNVSGAVVGARNAPVAGAQVQLIGPSTVNAVSDAGGTFQLDQLAPGTYAVRVEAEGYLVKLDQLEVVADNTARPQLVLTEKPRRSVVDLRENEIVITKQINFVTNKATIRPDAEPILVEVADVMLRNPQIQLVEIQGHTDDRGRPERNMTLSQERAESVRQWLLGAGIAAERFEARGYGQTQPIDSNKTAAGRTKNRRVQFIIRRQGPSQAASE